MKHDSYDLYQLLNEPDGRYRFCSYEFAQSLIRAKDYTHVYSGLLDVVGTVDGILEKLYQKHNTDYPTGREVRSMSVSDIVVLHLRGKASAWYVDSIGFQKFDWEG